MSRRGATADDWRHFPISPDRRAIPYRDEFTDTEMDLIRQGYIPEEMEEKWFIYVEGNWLYLHRSWTGFCIYMVRFEEQDGRFVVAEAWASQDDTIRNIVSPEHDALQLRSIIRLLLLDECVDFPGSPGDSDGDAAIRMWSLVGKEMMRSRGA